MTATLIAMAAALAPANVVMLVAQRDLARARDRWLLGVLAMGSVWLALHGQFWASLMGVWYVLSWRDETARSSLIVWGGVLVSWFLLRSVSPTAWVYIPWAWLALACVQVGMCVRMWWTVEFPKDNRPKLGFRTKGTLGSPVITAIFLVAVLPFSPWWLWPVFAIGFWFTWSYTAFLGVVVGALMLNPTVGVWLLGAFAFLLFTLWVSKRNSQDFATGVKARFSTQRLLEGSPRGDSVDGWTGRFIADKLLLGEWWRGGRRWLGQGPGSAGKAVQRWNSQQAQELPNGECHNDGLQLLYEYGLLGVAAAVAFVWPISVRLMVGDPWAAAWVICVVISLVHWPLRHPAIAMLFLAVSARLA